MSMGIRAITNTSLQPKSFGLIFYSKVTDAKGDIPYDVSAENLRALFEHLAQPQLVRRVYFVDDSRKDYQRALFQLLSSCVARRCPDAEIVQVTDNGSIYNAVNRVWNLVREEYVIDFCSEIRMIETLPLQTVLKAFERYRKLYLMYLRVRGLWGYKDAVKDQLRQGYPWYRDYPDEARDDLWYYSDRQNRVYSISYRLYVKQDTLPEELRGVQLVPRPIDADNTLWTPKLPSKLLPTSPIHERFAGGVGILRTKVVRKYLPLPEEYRNQPAAACLEVYFLTTDIDFKFYTGYLNLQAFATGFGDPKRGLFEVQREYWEEFRKINSQPVIQNGPYSWILEIELWALRVLHTVMLTRYRQIMADLLRRFMRKPFKDKVRIIQQLALDSIYTLFHLLPSPKSQDVHVTVRDILNYLKGKGY